MAFLGPASSVWVRGRREGGLSRKLIPILSAPFVHPASLGLSLLQASSSLALPYWSCLMHQLYFVRVPPRTAFSSVR